MVNHSRDISLSLIPSSYTGHQCCFYFSRKDNLEKSYQNKTKLSSSTSNTKIKSCMHSGHKPTHMLEELENNSSLGIAIQSQCCAAELLQHAEEIEWKMVPWALQCYPLSNWQERKHPSCWSLRDYPRELTCSPCALSCKGYEALSDCPDRFWKKVLKTGKCLKTLCLTANKEKAKISQNLQSPSIVPSQEWK